VIDAHILHMHRAFPSYAELQVSHLLHCCYTAVTLLLHGCYIVVTLLTHC
jgi:hypothetical protein